MHKEIKWGNIPMKGEEYAEQLSIQKLTRIENGKSTISKNSTKKGRSSGGLTNKKNGHISKLGKKYGGKFFDPNGPSHEIKLMGAKAMAEKSSKEVIQFDLKGNLIKEWNSINDAKRDGYHAGNISKCCNNKKPQYRGFIWKFKKDCFS